jgi:hypothetical protein
MSDVVRGRFHAIPDAFNREPSWNWHAEVWQSNKVLWSDNCRDPSKLVKDFEKVLDAFRTLAAKGHTFESWYVITERSMEDL